MEEPRRPHGLHNKTTMAAKAAIMFCSSPAIRSALRWSRCTAGGPTMTCCAAAEAARMGRPEVTMDGWSRGVVDKGRQGRPILTTHPEAK